jgi:hypothetical protein
MEAVAAASSLLPQCCHPKFFERNSRLQNQNREKFLYRNVEWNFYSTTVHEMLKRNYELRRCICNLHLISGVFHDASIVSLNSKKHLPQGNTESLLSYIAENTVSIVSEVYFKRI